MTRSSSHFARVTLRQICGLGLPAPLLLPSLLAALRQVVPSAHAAFFYCDEEGNIVNLYAERMLPPDAMALYHERHFKSDVSAFARGYLERVHAGSPVSRRSVTDIERKSDYYRDVLSQIGVEHMLYGIVRQHQNVIGQLSLYRDGESPAFSGQDEEALADVLHYLGNVLAGSGKPSAYPSLEQVAEEAVAVIGPDGGTTLADANWLRLARMARGEPIAPDRARVETDALAKFLAGILATVRGNAKGRHSIESAWGRFSFRAFELKGAAGEDATALVVSRLSMEPVGFAEGAARLGLTPQQREVALLLTRGTSNAAIAKHLGVSVNTAHYHVKRLFLRLGIHERQQIATVLREAAGEYRAAQT